MATVPAWQRLRAAGQGGTGSAAGNKAAAAKLPVTPTTPVTPAPTSTPRAQGRDVVNQGGTQGVVGRGGNFQPLGTNALGRLGARPPGGTGTVMTDGVMQGNGFIPGAGGAEAPGIESAIQSLQSQLGQPNPGMREPDFMTNISPEVQRQIQDRLTASPQPTTWQDPGFSGNYTKPMPNFGALLGARLQGRGATAAPVQAPGSPYLNLLRQRLSGAGGAQPAYM